MKEQKNQYLSYESIVGEREVTGFGPEELEAAFEPNMELPPIMGASGEVISEGDKDMEMQRQIEGSRWVSLEEAAAELGITPRSVRRIVHKGHARAEIEERTVTYKSIKQVCLDDLEKYREEFGKFDAYKNKR